VKQGLKTDRQARRGSAWFVGCNSRQNLRKEAVEYWGKAADGVEGGARPQIKATPMAQAEIVVETKGCKQSKLGRDIRDERGEESQACGDKEEEKRASFLVEVNYGGRRGPIS